MTAASPRTPIEAAREAAERLQGTCNSIVSLGEEFEDLQNDAEFCVELDQLVFCCVRCDWWCALSEMSDDEDGVCMDCE